MLLADAVDPLKGLYEQWPWMIVVIGVARWFATILERVATRHISFVDALDERDKQSLQHEATTTAALVGIDARLDLVPTKSDVKAAMDSTKCPYQPPKPAPVGV